MAKNEEATFFYFKWEDVHNVEKPYIMFLDVPEGFPPTNYVSERGTIEKVCDIRACEDEFNLDDHGFAVRRQDPHIGIISDESVTREFLPHTQTLMKEELFGRESKIIWFDWRIRTSDKTRTELPAGTRVQLDDSSVPLAPIQSAHVDQSTPAALNRVRRHTGKEADLLLKGRVRIINVWKPLRQPVTQYPLAVCDGSTVPSDKLVEIDVVRQSYVGGIYNLLPFDGYRWYFLSDQTPEEVLFMKMYDSSPQVKAKCCPHAAFRRESSSETFRESIEARALVFTRD